MKNSLNKKQEELENILADKVNFIAFSGGVDSTLLAAISAKVARKTLAITVKSGLIPGEEVVEAAELAEEMGIHHLVVPFNEQDHENIVENPVNRCYYCKKEIIRIVKKRAGEWLNKEGETDVSQVRILDGTNASDLNENRPGYRAMVEEKIISPFIETGITKNDIRKLAREHGLPNAEKPSQACLASRVKHGIHLDKGRLNRIAEAEHFLKERFNLRVVRVRDHGDLARIETSREEIQKILDVPVIYLIDKELKKLGFKVVSIDTGGYRTGSMS